MSFLAALPLITGIIQLAPSIANLIGKGEKEAQFVADIAKQVTGESDEAEALKSLQNNPALVVELEKAVMENEFKHEELVLKNTTDARARDTKFVQAGTRNYRADFLVAVNVIMTVTLLVVIIRHNDLSEFAQTALNVILGVCLANWKDVHNFEFGTTRKSDAETAAIVKDYIRS